MDFRESRAHQRMVESHTDRCTGQLRETTHQLPWNISDVGYFLEFQEQHLDKSQSGMLNSDQGCHLQLGVPHKVVVNDSSPMIFARPKSANLIDRFLSVSKMFSGLMSRCTMFLSWRYFVPWNNWMKTFRVSASVNFCFVTIQLNNSPSAASSKTRKTPSGSSKVSLRHRTFG